MVNSKQKIALIEDDIAIRDLYELKFKLEGYDVSVASNGEEGLELIKKEKPDLILLDLKMPVMNGEDMLEELRRHDWAANMRVIILTNISKDEAPSKLRFLNVDRYIVKAHHTPAQIVDIVKSIID